MFDSRPDDDVTAIRSRHSAAYQNNFFCLAHLHHLQVLDCHTSIAHVTRHSLVLPNASRCRAITHRTDAPVHFRTVSGALPGKIVFLHHALEPFAFRTADHINEVASLKLGNAQVDLALGKIVLQAKFADKPLWFGSSLLEFT